MANPVVSLLPEAQQQFCDQNGAPLAAGLVYHYVPGTTTPANTWADPGLTVLNPNPVQLDLAGRATIWGNTQYRQIVHDAFGNQEWDLVTGVPTVSIPSLGNGSLGMSGWWQLPAGGPLLQWQTLTFATNQTVTQNYPIPFPNTAFASVACSGSFDGNIYSPNISSLSNSQFNVNVVGSSEPTVTMQFIHLGY